MDWLESWAKAVVYASKTDQAERLDSNPRITQWNAQSDHIGDDGSLYGAALGKGNLERSVQARRRAMKATVRNQYAFSTMAKLWAEEMAG